MNARDRAVRVILADVPDRLRPSGQPTLVALTDAIRPAIPGGIRLVTSYSWRDNGGADAILYESSVDDLSPPDVAVAVVRFAPPGSAALRHDRTDLTDLVVPVDFESGAIGIVRDWLRSAARARP
jgi:hypothetical protein